MKVLFLHESVLEESLGVANLSAVLKSEGHACDVLIQNVEGRNFFKKIADFKPRVIAFSCTTGRHVWANRIAGEIKKTLDVVSIMGGMHPTTCPEEAIRQTYIDSICIGEGEYPLLDLVNGIQQKKDITTIKNLWVKQDNKTYRNEIRVLNDINSLPYPDRGIFFKYAYNRAIPVKRFMSGVGCPFSCSFCQNPVLMNLYKGKGNFVRRKEVPRIIAEISHVKENYPLELVHFSDDIFVLNKDWLAEFSKHYKKAIGLPFNCNARLSCLDDDAIRILKETGCHAVGCGLESGNEYLRNTILSKNSSNNEIIEKVALLKKYKIKVITGNMIALPHEQIADAYETIRLNRKIGTTYIRVFTAKPFKGTALFEYGRRHNLLNENALNENNYSNLDNIYFKTPHEKEFKNIRYLFYLFMKFPFLEHFSGILVQLPLSKVYKLVFFITSALQEKQCFRVGLLKGLWFGIRMVKGCSKHY